MQFVLQPPILPMRTPSPLMSRNARNNANGKFDEISRKAEVRVNELEKMVPTKRRFRRIKRIWLSSRSLAKYRQIRHSRRIRQNRRFVGTFLSSSFALISIFGEISSNSPFSLLRAFLDTSPLCSFSFDISVNSTIS